MEENKHKNMKIADGTDEHPDSQMNEDSDPENLENWDIEFKLQDYTSVRNYS